MAIEDDMAAYDQMHNDLSSGYQPPQQQQSSDQGVYTVSPSDFKPASQVPGGLPKEKPGFLKSVEMIGSGAAQGSLQYTAALMNSLNSGVRKLVGLDDSGYTPETPFSRAYNYWNEKNQADKQQYSGAGLLQSAGKLGGELLSTAPAGMALGAVAKGGEAASALASQAGILPKVLPTVAKYGTNAAGGAAVLAGLQGADNPNGGFSPEQAAAALKQPSSYIIPMAGTYLGGKVANWAQNAQDLEAAKQIIPSVTNRNLAAPGAMTTAKNMMFDGVPNIAGMSKSVATQDNIGTDISNYINKLSGNLVANSSGDYKAIAGQQFQKTLQGLQDEVNNAWAQVPKTAPITQNIDDITNSLNSAHDILSGLTSIPDSKLTRDLITNTLNKQNLTVNDIKTLATSIGSRANNAINMEGGQETGSALYDIRKQLVNAIQSNLSPEDQKAYTAATTLSNNFYDTMAISPKIQNALYSEVDARNLSKSMMSEAEALDKSKAMGLTTDVGQKAMVASKLMQILESAGANSPNGVNLNSFITGVKNSQALPALANTDTMNSIKGLNNVLTGIYNSAGTKVPGVVSGPATAGLGMGLYTGAIPPMAAGAGAATYAALAAIANNSPIKSALGILGRNAPEGSLRQGLSKSTYDYLSNKVGNLLSRSGYFIDNNGTLDKKDSK